MNKQQFTQVRASFHFDPKPKLKTCVYASKSPAPPLLPTPPPLPLHPHLQSIFELADHWVDSINAQDYEDFMYHLLWEIAKEW